MGYTKPNPPENFRYTFSGTTLNVSWDAASGGAGAVKVTPSYAIRIDNGSWTDVAAGTSHSFPGLTLGTTYAIDVRARISDSFHSVTGGISTIQANSNSVPGAPGSPSTSELAANSVKLSWTASSGTVTTYEVSSDGGDTWIDSGSDDTEHSFSILSPNTEYTLQVRARNGAALSAVSEAPPITTLPSAVPGAPGSPTTSAITATSITLTWTASSGVVDTYEVSTDGSTWTDAGGDLEHVFSSLTANTAYTLRARGKNRAGVSAAASAASVKTLPNPPTAPTTSAITASGMTLSWTAGADGAETYEVSSDGGTTWVDAGGTDTTHSFSGLDANTAYVLQVRAKNSSGVSAAVSAASVKTLPNPPTAPATSAITASGMTLSWTAGEDGAETYEVSSDGGTTWVDAGGTDTTHSFSGLDANTAYVLQVRAKNASGVSAAASAASVKTLPDGVPGIPGSPTTSAITATSITLTWTGSTGVVDTYEVSSDGGDTWVDSGSGDTEHSFSGLDANTAYVLQVRARNAIGASSAASATSVTTLPSAVPGVPGSPTTSAITATSITLAWTASTGVVDTYEVSTDGSTWTDAGGDLEHVFSSLTANTAYTLRARGKNRAGVSAAASAASVKTLPNPPTAPTTSAITASGMTLSWTAGADGAETYEVSSDGGTTWVDAGGDDTEHSFSGLDANTAYVLQVRAKNSSGVSAAVSAASVKTLPNPPTAPATSAITASGMTLSWTAGEDGAETYEVSSDGGTTWVDAGGTDTTHSFSGLDANTAYVLQVRAKNASGVSAAVSAASVKTLPNPPTAPTTSAITASGITLSWTAGAGGAETYEVSSDGGTTWVDAGGTDTTHSFSSLTANTAYTLQVRAKNSSGVSAAVSAASVKTLPNPPTAPATSAITASGMTLSWTAGEDGAETYEVSSDGGTTWVDAGGDDTEHSFSGLDANTAYVLQVRAKNASGVSAAASAASVKTLPDGVPGIPGSPTTSAITATSITLTWTGSTGVVDTYEVSSDGGDTWVDSGSGDTEHSFSGLDANTAYVLQVRARNAIGASSAASATSVTTLPSAVPGVPGSPTTSAITATSITLTWTASSGVVDTYEVSTDGSTWTDAGSDLEHVFSSLTANTAYTLQVRAKNSSGASSAASATSVTTLPSAVPGVPGSPTTSAITATSITLTWTASTGVVDTYEVSTDGSTWTDAGSDLEHILGSLTANTAYTLQVRGKNRAGVSSAASAASVTTLPAGSPGIPGSPTTSAITASSITLTWTASSGVVDTYEVSSDGGTTWVDAGGTDTTHSFTGLDANTAYVLQVRARNAIGASSAASATSVTTLPSAVPGVPGSPTTSAITASSITLTWTASSGVVDTYEVSTDGSAWTDAGSDLEHVFSSLTANTAYTLQVRGKNRAGVSAAASAASVKTLPAGVPGIPGSPTTSAITASSITLTWTGSTGIVDTYEVSSDSGDTWVDSGSGDTEHRFTGLDANTAYVLQVRAKNSSGVSAAVSATSVKTLPNPPTAATTSAITASGMSLSWTAGEDGAETYEVSSDGGTTWVDAGGDDTEHSFSGLDANTAYVLQVRAKNSSGVSAAVSAASVKTLPNPPTGLQASDVDQTSVTINWKKSQGATSYEVQGWVDPNQLESQAAQDGIFDSWINVGDVDSYTFSPLNPNTPYIFGIHAMNNVGASEDAMLTAQTLPETQGGVPVDEGNVGSGGFISDGPSSDDEEDGSDGDGDSSRTVSQPTLTPSSVACRQTLNELPQEIVVRYWQLCAQGRRVGSSEIGDAAVIEQGIVDAIDLWGYVTPGIEVCFRRRGEGLVFLDAGTAPRTKIPWLGYPSDGMTCTVIDRPGTLVLLASSATSGSIQPAPVQPGSSLLSNCVVELTAYLNFREAPWGAIIQILAPGLRLTALESRDGWYKVDFYGRNGWIIGDSVIPIGDCTAPAPAPAAPQPIATAEPASSSLADCMVELTEYLNFREAPWGAIIHQLAPGISLTAIEYEDGWYKVDYYGRKGWITESFVVPSGSC